MKRWHRKALRALAAPLYPAAEALITLAEWLRAKAERPARPRPLRFPNPTELSLDAWSRKLSDMNMREYKFLAQALWEGRVGHVLDDAAPFVPLKIRTPADGD